MAASNDTVANKEAIVSAFEPSLWGDFFVTYTSPLQRSEEWMRERRDQLNGEVRRMFEAAKAMSMADTVKLVDTLERLGIDNHHFVKEIDEALCHVFDKFRDGTVSFNMNLSNDPRGLLSLYNAAHMAVPGEMVLDDAITFTRRHLEVAKGKLRSPMEEQVSRSLEIPLPRLMWQIEAAHYITEYEKEDEHDAMILELARLNLNLLRSVHLKELKSLPLWWRDLYDNCYFYSITVFHGEESSVARIILAKLYALFVLLDDTFDVRATIEESQMLDEALQSLLVIPLFCAAPQLYAYCRCTIILKYEGTVSLLPEYLRMCYIKLLSTFNNIEDILEPSVKYRMAYVKRQTKWLNENCTPSFKEQIDVAVMVTGFQLMFLTALTGAGQVVNNEAFGRAHNMPDMSHATAEIVRFINDIAAYKLGKCKNDAPSVVECYMKEYGMTEEEAMVAVAEMVEQAWRRMNRDYIEMKGTIKLAAQCLLNLGRSFETFYLHGNKDGVTYGSDVKELITLYFLKEVHV
ncbi:hypothetical protein GQ55_8G252500 [Panicum hallii var. hallii]|uniref:Terpene synthase N-terminal domain-containing protein n=1 Tax=Panicum hallii var. hallii TaxID=1504633 RepID=A0A2T7CR27_9POAL|nr:hypothetical protein GQ55_8G252500 [Panicum hallii var. hallii]